MVIGISEKNLPSYISVKALLRARYFTNISSIDSFTRHCKTCVSKPCLTYQETKTQISEVICLAHTDVNIGTKVSLELEK